MVENQHRNITGYRDLTEDEIGAMNDCKALGAEIGDASRDQTGSVEEAPA